MIAVLNFVKPSSFVLPVLAVVCLIYAEQVSAQASTTVQHSREPDTQLVNPGYSSPPPPPASAPAPASNYAVPENMMRGSGKWIDNLSFHDIAPDPAPAKTTAPSAAAATALPYFKPAAPGWIGALDTASYLIGIGSGIQGSGMGFSGKPYAPAPRINDPVPPTN